MQKTCRLSLIVAVADNGVIGLENNIPWKCSSDMKYFRKVTMGKPVIMGRKTWDSLGRPLKGRHNIVVTRNAGYTANGARTVSGALQALDLARSFPQEDKECEIMIIGGKAIYDEFISLADRVYYTLIHLSPEGDAFFFGLQQLVGQGWKEISRKKKAAAERDDADMTFIILEK
jgi:dihydrofolate reductase